MRTMTVNVKHILEGKPDAGEENIALQAGDTVIVHGNLFKALNKVSSLVGVTTLVTFLGRGGR